MKNPMPFLLAAALLSSCVWLENPVSLGRSRSDAMGERTIRPKAGDPGEPDDTCAHLYISAVEYPKDYDWVRDTAHTLVDARILLFKDGECTASIPAGDSRHVSTDPDTHWILGGHLYTTFSDGARTYILRDGAELLRFDGAEDIRGMLLKENMLWTLGQKIRGEGFTLRCDGTAAAENQQGLLIGRLYEDKGDLCYAYMLTVKAGNYILRKYFLCAGGTEKEVSVPSDAQAVFDIRRVGGITYATYRQSSVPVGPVLSSDGGSQSLYYNLSTALSPDWCEIIPWKDDILVKGWYNCTKDMRRYVLWSKTGMKLLFIPQIVIHDFLADERGNIAAVGYDTRTDETVIYLPPNATSRVSLGKRYRFISHRVAALAGDHFYVGLTGNGEDLLCLDSKRTPVTVNGPVTGLAYQ